MRIILIDDSQETFLLVKTVLGEKYELFWAPSIREGEAALRTQKIDLVLLDVMLPDGDGFGFCARHQNTHANIPIVFVTGKTGTSNLITGLALGAEDYVQKPFDPLELQARVEAKLKRIEKRRTGESILFKGDLKMNLESRNAWLLGKSDIALQLTPLEFKLLWYLAKHEEHVFSRDQLISAVWGENVAVTDRTVDKNISTLRQKLVWCATYLETVAGFGYKFSVKKTVTPPAVAVEVPPPTAPVMIHDRVKELDHLGKHVGSDVLGDMVSLFTLSAPSRVRAMSFAFTKKNWITVEREAHTLKSAAGILGLLQLQERCRDIGRALNKREFQSLENLIALADVDLRSALSELNNYYESSSPRVA